MKIYSTDFIKQAQIVSYDAEIRTMQYFVKLFLIKDILNGNNKFATIGIWWQLLEVCFRLNITCSIFKVSSQFIAVLFFFCFLQTIISEARNYSLQLKKIMKTAINYLETLRKNSKATSKSKGLSIQIKIAYVFNMEQYIPLIA